MKKQNILNIYNTITIILLDLLMYLLVSEKILRIIVESGWMKAINVVFGINFFILTFISLKNKDSSYFFKFGNFIMIFLQIIGIITLNNTLDFKLMLKIYYLVNIIYLSINLFGILYNWLYQNRKRILKIIYMCIVIICLILVFNYYIIEICFGVNDRYLEDNFIILLISTIIVLALNILNLIIYIRKKSQGDAILFCISSLCYVLILFIELYGFNHFQEKLLNEFTFKINSKYETQEYKSNTLVAFKNNKAGLINADTGENVVDCIYRLILQVNVSEKTDIYICEVDGKDEYHLLLKDGTFLLSSKDTFILTQFISVLIENLNIEDEYLFSDVFKIIEQEYSIFNYLKPVQSNKNTYYYNFNEKYDLKLIYDSKKDIYNLYSKNKQTNVITKINQKNDELELKFVSNDDIWIKIYTNGSIPFTNDYVQCCFNENLERVVLNKDINKGEIKNILNDKYIFEVYNDGEKNGYYFMNSLTNEIEGEQYLELGVINNKYIIYGSKNYPISITDMNDNTIRTNIKSIYRYLDKYIITDITRRYILNR